MTEDKQNTDEGKSHLLIASKRFGPFFVTQFFGAFNDNVFKNALVILLTFNVAVDTDRMVNLAAGLFILPFLLFSGIAGQLADKLDKAWLIRRIKIAEIILMTIAFIGYLDNNLVILFSVLFLTGCQSAFFGPVKYGILPQNLKKHELVSGNALVESGTFLAILLGTIVGGILANYGEEARGILVTVLISVAVIGWIASQFIPATAVVDPDHPIDWNPWRTTLTLVKLARKNHTVQHCIIAISWFWAFGALFLTQFPNYTRLTLGGDASVATVLLAVFSIGIGLGSWMSKILSKGNIEPGVVPIGAIGMTLFSIDLGLIGMQPVTDTLVNAQGFLSSFQNWHVIADLILIALSGGIYIVQLYAMIQTRSDPQIRSRIIAANNILNSLFMVCAAIFAVVILKSGLSIPQLFIAVGCLNILITASIFMREREFIQRLKILVSRWSGKQQ